MEPGLSRLIVLHRNPNLRHPDRRRRALDVATTQPLNGALVTFATAFATRRAVRQLVPVSMMSCGVTPSARMSPHWRVICDTADGRAAATPALTPSDVVTTRAIMA